MLSSVLPVTRNLPSEHPRVPFLPGLKRRPVTPLPLLLLLALLIGSGAFLWIRSSKNAAAPERETASGRVLQVERIGANVPANSQSAFVKYRFMAGQKLTYGSEIAPPQTTIPDVGDRVEISYERGEPQNNYRVAAGGEPLSASSNPLSVVLAALLLLMLSSFFISILSPVSLGDWLAWRRARNLYRNGEITAGRVQFVRPDTKFHSLSKIADHEIVATYKVEGVRLLATTRTNNAWLVNQLAPEVEVVVAYDPLKPERAVILEPFAF